MIKNDFCRLRVVSSFPLGDRREMRVGRGQKKREGGRVKETKRSLCLLHPSPLSLIFCPRPTLISRRSPRGKEETTRSLDFCAIFSWSICDKNIRLYNYFFYNLFQPPTPTPTPPRKRLVPYPGDLSEFVRMIK